MQYDRALQKLNKDRFLLSSGCDVFLHEIWRLAEISYNFFALKSRIIIENFFLMFKNSASLILHFC